jgi:hypothetical protein
MTKRKKKFEDVKSGDLVFFEFDFDSSDTKREREISKCAPLKAVGIVKSFDGLELRCSKILWSSYKKWETLYPTKIPFNLKYIWQVESIQKLKKWDDGIRLLLEV